VPAKKKKPLHKGRSPVPPPGGPMKHKNDRRRKEWKKRIKDDEK
jgi:hypothetical protein